MVDNKVAKKKSGKIIIVDTSAIVENYEYLYKFANSDNTVEVSYVVNGELDHLKTDPGERGHHARRLIKILNELSKKGSLIDGVKTDEGGVIKLNCRDVATITGLSDEERAVLNTLPSNDRKIVSLAIILTKELPNEKVVLVTLDTGMEYVSRTLGVVVEDIEDIRVDMRDLSKGIYREIVLSKEAMQVIKENGRISALDIESALDGRSLLNNEFVVANNNRQCVMRHLRGMLTVIPPATPIFSIKPMAGSLSQKFAWDLMFDKNIELVALIGPAGVGKTFIPVVAALAQLKGFPECGYEKLYDRIVVLTPTAPASEDQKIGYIPGSKTEKMSEWVQGVLDNLKMIKKMCTSLVGGSREAGEVIDNLIEDGLLEFTQYNSIRGRSIGIAFIIVDESQNFKRSETKLIGTRVAMGSKVVFTGDVSQVNRAYVGENNNGLVHVVKAFKGDEDTGVVFASTNEIVRSKVARKFAEKF